MKFILVLMVCVQMSTQFNKKRVQQYQMKIHTSHKNYRKARLNGCMLNIYKARNNNPDSGCQVILRTDFSDNNSTNLNTCIELDMYVNQLYFQNATVYIFEEGQPYHLKNQRLQLEFDDILGEYRLRAKDKSVKCIDMVGFLTQNDLFRKEGVYIVHEVDNQITQQQRDQALDLFRTQLINRKINSVLQKD